MTLGGQHVEWRSDNAPQQVPAGSICWAWPLTVTAPSELNARSPPSAARSPPWTRCSANLHAAAITALTGPDIAFAEASHVEIDRGHGRTEQRTTRTAPADGIDFPHAAQVFRILRYRGGLDGQRHSKQKQVVYGITDLTAEQAGAAQIATYVRDHWKAIENGTHHVRDVTFGEDAHQARTGALPRILALGALRHAGHTNIAHARRHHVYDHQRPLDLFNIRPAGSN